MKFGTEIVSEPGKKVSYVPKEGSIPGKSHSSRWIATAKFFACGDAGEISLNKGDKALKIHNGPMVQVIISHAKDRRSECLTNIF